MHKHHADAPPLLSVHNPSVQNATAARLDPWAGNKLHFLCNSDCVHMHSFTEFRSKFTSKLVQVCSLQRKSNYRPEHVLFPNTRGRCECFQRVNIRLTSYQNGRSATQHRCYVHYVCRSSVKRVSSPSSCSCAAPPSADWSQIHKHTQQISGRICASGLISQRCVSIGVRIGARWGCEEAGWNAGGGVGGSY